MPFCLCYSTGLLGVLFVLLDSYVDPEYKDNGGRFLFAPLRFFLGNYYIIAHLLISNLGCHVGAATRFGLAYVIMDLVGCK